MAKRRRRTFRRKVRRASTRRVAPRRRRKSGSTSRTALMAAGVGGFAYGALREPLSNFVAPLTSRIPIAGNMSDELVLGLGAAWLAKKAKNKMVKRVAMAAVTLESARLGESLAGGLVGGLLGGGGASPSTPVLGATFR